MTLCGKVVELTLRSCGKCDEPTWFTAGAFVCDECASEFIEIGGTERPSVKRSDYFYQGDVADKTEELGQPRSDEGGVIGI